MKKILPFVKPVVAISVLAGLATAGYLTREYWLPLFHHAAPAGQENASPTVKKTSDEKKIVLTDPAIANLALKAKPVHPETYWKTIQVPGMVVDRPGRSDRAIVSPVIGVITKVHYFPGDTVRPGEKLFTILLLSESLHKTQTDLFKATQDIVLAQANLMRLQIAGKAIARARLIEVENEITRLEVAVKSYRRELLNRGLLPDQIDKAAEGDFVKQINIFVPPQNDDAKPLTGKKGSGTFCAQHPSGRSRQNVPDPFFPGGKATLPQPTFEVQELKVDLGRQVQVGQTLCVLANHRMLAIEGRAFRDETALLERSVKQGWAVEVDFQENAEADWPAIKQTFHIRHIANYIDPVKRTFGFLIPLENESKVVNAGGRAQMLWRFRPGQKVRIKVKIQPIENVFILPADAVTRDLAEAFVFTQNVNTFLRKPVRIVAQDRQHTIVANDGSLAPGSFVVQNAAAQLNRMTKSQSNSGLPPGYHMHADGSLHKNENVGE